MGSTQNWNTIDAIRGFNNKSLRHPIHSIQKILIGTCCCFIMGAFLGITDADAGPYVGYVSTAEFVDASYTKTVDNTDPRNVSTQKDKVNRAESNAVGGINGLGYQFGYRTPLGEKGFFLSGEIDTLHHSGSVYGNIEEEGTSEAPNQVGESWSEYWTFQRSQSYGLTLKLGGSPGTLRSWKAGVYVLAGVRLANSRLDAYYNGCFKQEPCAIGDYDSGRFSKDSYYTAWTSGLGVEKKLVDNVWLEVEGRYTSYGKRKWVTSFHGLGVKVTSGSVNQTATLRFNVVVR